MHCTVKCNGYLNPSVVTRVTARTRLLARNTTRVDCSSRSGSHRYKPGQVVSPQQVYLGICYESGSKETVTI